MANGKHPKANHSLVEASLLAHGKEIAELRAHFKEAFTIVDERLTSVEQSIEQMRDDIHDLITIISGKNGKTRG